MGSGNRAIASFWTRSACCQKRKRIKCTGWRLDPPELSPTSCWHQFVFCAACRTANQPHQAGLHKTMEITEEVSGVFELMSSLRAFFATLVYTSIDQKDWFGFEESEQFVDQVFKWLHLRLCGQRAPIVFYTEAFQNSTCATCQTALRAHQTLTSVKDNFWTVFVPNSKVDSTRGARERKDSRKDTGHLDNKTGHRKRSGRCKGEAPATKVSCRARVESCKRIPCEWYRPWTNSPTDTYRHVVRGLRLSRNLSATIYVVQSFLLTSLRMSKRPTGSFAHFGRLRADRVQWLSPSFGDKKAGMWLRSLWLVMLPCYGSGWTGTRRAAASLCLMLILLSMKRAHRWRTDDVHLFSLFFLFFFFEGSWPLDLARRQLVEPNVVTGGPHALTSFIPLHHKKESMSESKRMISRDSYWQLETRKSLGTPGPVSGGHLLQANHR